MLYTLILFLIISPFIGKVGQKLSSKSGIPIIILFIFFGLCLGKYSPIDILNREDMQQAVFQYSNIISVTLIFLLAGLSLSLDSIKKNIKTTINLSVLPVYIGVAVITFISILYFYIFNFHSIAGREFNFFGIFLFSYMIVMSAPILIIPPISKLKDKYIPVKEIVLPGYILDNYTLIPIVFCVTAVGIIEHQGNVLSLSTIPLIVIGSLLSIAITTVAGLALGYLSYFIKRTLKISNKNIVVPFYFLFCIGGIFFLDALPIVGEVFTIFTLIFIISFGVSLRAIIPQSEIRDLVNGFQEFILLFAFPIMFIGLGGRMDVGQLFNIKVILFIVLIFIVNRGVKLLVINQILKHQNFDLSERKLALNLGIFDGASPINTAIAIAPLLIMLGQEDITILASLYGICTFIFTIIIGNKAIQKYLN